MLLDRLLLLLLRLLRVLRLLDVRLRLAEEICEAGGAAEALHSVSAAVLLLGGSALLCTAEECGEVGVHLCLLRLLLLRLLHGGEELLKGIWIHCAEEVANVGNGAELLQYIDRWLLLLLLHGCRRSRVGAVCCHRSGLDDQVGLL